jgi:hypothetical protein
MAREISTCANTNSVYKSNSINPKKKRKISDSDCSSEESLKFNSNLKVKEDNDDE